MEFIRWHALSSYIRWYEYIERKEIKCLEFINNLPEISLKWAEENHYSPKSSSDIMDIGKEMIKRFKPDIIFVFAPLTYVKNNFLNELISSLRKKPKLIAWYGANCGDENIFKYYDLTLSNSKHLVNNLRKKGIKAEFLQHAFDPIILEKIKLKEKRINKAVFLGNLQESAEDFKERNKILCFLSKRNGLVDIYGDIKKTNSKDHIKYSLLKGRMYLSKFANRFTNFDKINYWSDISNMPSKPDFSHVDFIKKIKKPLYGKKMLEKLASYGIALNCHNLHTGNYACNMRLFEATGVGCALITDKKDDIEDYYDVGNEIIVFEDYRELPSIIKELMNDNKLRNKISILGQKRTLSNHTTKLQVDKLCEYFFNI